MQMLEEDWRRRPSTAISQVTTTPFGKIAKRDESNQIRACVDEDRKLLESFQQKGLKQS